MTEPFTITHYAECINAIGSNNIEIIHDLDYLTPSLIDMARIERSANITTTYFIRLRANYYNALSFENLKTFRRLNEEFGHHLGLHFEPSLYPSSSHTKAIELERSLLELALLIPNSINALSVHLPGKFGGVNESNIPSNMKYYCYDASYYSGKKYISDSGGRWREGGFASHIGKHQSMIVLIHPQWWYHENPAENY